MTGLKNYAFFLNKLKNEIKKAASCNYSLSLFFADIDFFKNFNDKYGHMCGDFVLKKVGELILRCTRDTDLVARYGGEEFCLLIPDTSQEIALQFAERIRMELEKERFSFKGQDLCITISIGVYFFDPINDEIAQEWPKYSSFIDRADMALYKAKKNGRNRVELYYPDDEITDK